MEVIVKNADEANELPFPKLMINQTTGDIVFFVRPRIGLCVAPLSSVKQLSEVSNSCDGWLMNCFTDFKGVITIKQ